MFNIQLSNHLQFSDNIIMKVIVSNFLSYFEEYISPYFTEIYMSICEDENDNKFG